MDSRLIDFFIRAKQATYEKYDSQKAQKILGQDAKEALRILEENGKGLA